MVGVVPAPAQQASFEQGLTASILSVYTPPACVSGVPFADITCTTGFDPWIEQFGLDGITAGCGGGNYCPGSPVTRDQMAVLLEKAMRGTSNWPPHTVLVFHHPAGEANSNVNSGTELLSMVAAIPSTGPEAPSATNPWLIRLGPGIYDLGSGSLTLPVYTALEGAGQDITVITGTGYADMVHGTVIIGDHGRLSRLTVNNSGGNSFEIAVYLPGLASVANFEHVTLSASNPSNTNESSALCLYSEGNTSFSLVDCELTAHGAHNNLGTLSPNSTGNARLDSVQVTVYGSQVVSGQSFGFNGTGSSVITNSRFSVSDGGTQDGIFQDGGSLVLRNGEIHVLGSGIGVMLNGASATLQGDLVVSQGWGVGTYGSGFIADISNCRVEGSPYWLVSALSYTTTVGASKLVGTMNNSGGTVNCFGNYTGTAFLANTCP
jgi:hypothetical protein